MIAGLQEAQVSAVAGVGSGVTAGLGAGVLEVKCPFNKGNPNGAAPLKLAQWYYMPQVLLHTTLQPCNQLPLGAAECCFL